MPLPETIVALLAAPRADLVGPLSELLANYIHPTDDAPERVRRGIAASLEATSEEDWRDYVAYLSELGRDWGRQDAHAVGRAMTFAMMDALLADSSALSGLHHIEAARATGRRVLITGNHLSYVDPTAAWTLMHRQGAGDLADALTAVAGPKVYAGEPMRLMGASATHAIKVAQSAQITSTGETLNARELVRITRASLTLGAELMDAGRVVLIYPEGTRSRTGGLGPFLRGVGRWLTMDGVLLVPFGLTGTNTIYTLEDDRLRPTEVRGAFGPAIDPGALVADGAGRDDVVAAARDAVRALLPPEMRGEDDALA